MPTSRLVILLVFIFILHACGRAVTWHGTDISGKMPNLEFVLTGPDGELLDAGSLKGKPVLVFFGFTNCPDVCPTTLTQLSVAIKKLGDQASHINVLLVSVDPERDTPAVMKRYTTAFGPWLTGVTGPDEKLAVLRKSYGVYAALESSAEKGTYNVMHSAAVFGFDSKGQARLLMTDVTDSDAVAANLKILINL